MRIPQPAVLTVTMETLWSADQSELCATSVDDNCDSQINENLAADCTQYFLDEDGDGWGVYDFICACQPQQAMKPPKWEIATTIQA